MNSKLLICLLIAFVANEIRPTQGFSINPFDFIEKKFGLDKFWNWNPFAQEPSSSEEDSDEMFEQDFIQDSSDSNETETKRNYYYGCECQDYQCGCCAHVEVHKLKLNNTGCLNMTYKDLENIELTFDLNKFVLYNNSISILNPPDLCFPLPMMPLAKLCLQFYKLDARNKSFTGSCDLIAKFDGKTLSRIKLGTFHFGNGSKYIEQNLMSVNMDKDKLFYIYGNLTDKLSKFNKASKNLALDTYEKLIEKLPKASNLSFNFQPEKMLNNLFKSVFLPRINANNNTSSEEIE